MNKSFIFLLSLIFFCPCFVFAGAQDWYSSVSTSFSLPSGKYKAYFDLNDASSNYSLYQDGGTVLSFGLGYEFFSGFDFSVEASLFELNERVGNNFDAEPTVHSISLYWMNKFDVGSNLSPYISFGIGIFKGSMQLPFSGELRDNEELLFDGSGLQSSFKFGFSYHLSQKFALDFGYKLISFSYSDAEISSQSFSRKINGLESDIHSFDFLFRIFWNS